MMIGSSRSSILVAPVIAALATDSFEAAALECLNIACGAEYFTLFRTNGERPEFIGGASVHGEHAIRRLYGRHTTWEQSAPDLHRARNVLLTTDGAILARSELSALGHQTLQKVLTRSNVVDRLVVCGRHGDDVYGISLLRTQQAGRFEPSALRGCRLMADILIALVAKHATLHWDRAKPTGGFTSIDAIEDRLHEAGWGISERELQVCARLLYGISALGISHDLGLREDTIATYRKRLYHRLQISSRHELIQKYLTLLN